VLVSCCGNNFDVACLAKRFQEHPHA